MVATGDHELVVLHDLVLDDVSDAASRFPSRARADGSYYVADFELEELRALQLCERRRPGSAELKFPERFAFDSPSLRIVTLDEELELVRSLNRATGRAVGIYPEIKHPRWHRDHGIDLSRLLVDALTRHGYSTADDSAFLQCFDAAELERVRADFGVRLRLIQLLDSSDLADRATLADRFDAIHHYADGVGVPYEALLDRPGAGPGDELRASPLPRLIERAGLELHPYTFRRDGLAGKRHELEALLRFFMTQIGVDGLFCDETDIAVRVREALSD